MECEITPDGKRHFNSLFRYEITENRVEGDKFIINGTHKKVCGISESLKKRFLENGMPREVLNNKIYCFGIGFANFIASFVPKVRRITVSMYFLISVSSSTIVKNRKTCV